MANSHSFTLLFTLFSYLTGFHFSSASSSPAIASDQLRFWSQNVHNKMPEPILKKLSPLSRNDYEYYSNVLPQNGKFSADSHFCSLAKLSCTFATAKYTQQNTYGINSAAVDQVKRSEDPFSFFRVSTLKTGNLVHLPNLQETLPDRTFLPPQIVSSIPLTYEGITEAFPEWGVGPTKETIQTTLAYCNAAAIEGETKSCPKSLEEMVGFATASLGGTKLLALTSKNSRGSGAEMIIGKMKHYGATKIVACHEAFLPFAAYVCHSLSSTGLYAVEVVDPKGGAAVNTLLAICHMDTSAWPKNHVAFEILKFGPGEGEACHWFTQLDLAWIPNESE
ncbi:BURP domain-containing protein 16 [Sesamum indicum]|uniref:BURP domain-containing protein 16 n=1 Tax=Sesamum indicum TaxID=4182 RepID=A0A6I9SUB2_SESIN|nr:BURP domain-containing protein 16 [Sesamum indicum]